jgi:hypothetical protein
VTLTNSGDVGALILASELITCQLASPREPATDEAMYEDKKCVVLQLVDHLYELDAKSSVAIASVLRQPLRPPHHVRLLTASVHLWYARKDRLQVGGLIATNETSDEAASCSSEAKGGNDVEVYEVQPNSCVELVVEQPRRLVFVRKGPAGDAYVAIQATNHQICDHNGFPEDDESVDRDVGLGDFRLVHESWVATK